jgi:hypothetical protein
MGIVFYFTAQPWSFLVFGLHDDSMGYAVQNWVLVRKFILLSSCDARSGRELDHIHTHGDTWIQLQELLQVKSFDLISCTTEIEASWQYQL